MVVIMSHDGRESPVIVCDVCGQVVENHGDANAVWGNRPKRVKLDIGGTKVKLYAVYHAHRANSGRNCDRILDARLGGVSGWEPLSHHMAYLESNIGLTTEGISEARAMARFLGARV